MTKIDADWLEAPSLQSLLAALSSDGEEARVVGGAVRNTILGHPVTDIDIATTTLPEETTRRVEAAGFKAVPTGFEHGTVTVVTPERPYEVTTLRKDIETDGRRAVVHFGRDWQADAERRDFTINALYATAAGEVVDLVGGTADIESRTLRFIGDAETRIREDYLRILRFFRFFAWYGAGRPDALGIRASARLKDGMQGLSAERVWAELKKLLAAPDPSRALLWMRQAGVLTQVLPESERWGIDTIHPLVAAEAAFGWPADPLLRLAAIVPPDAARLAELANRLRFSNADRDRLLAYAHAEPVDAGVTEASLTARLYFGDRQAIVDRLRLAVAAGRAKAEAGGGALEELAALTHRLSMAEGFKAPAFPLSGEDLRKAGVTPGPQMGRMLDKLKRDWVESGFVLGPEALLAEVATKKE
ncbi:CCA tRNA nucleotidyltransferase [Aurantimonas sp. VKM B-3413]|uniref:CCA tRNA nucleotidyltransferase n=1 Tax=Aurantimonas sp. VKM B-3413 TaxID=2779401 RepID=UPI001E295580|nr:CCA tRNA nucleotidyltransferase [Aurantimonas sp. VKM B-3413]MCB8838276.1 CCA tRNA nucleotidyltransferase [Aurantimonas sp. VKM B-3413]